MDETWLGHYDPETNNNQQSRGLAAHTAPKIPSAKIRWKTSRLDFLGSRRHSSLYSKRPNYQRGVLLISVGAFEGLWKEIAVVRSPRGFCSCTTMPRLTGHLQPRRNWPTWASNVLITLSSPDLAPSGYHLFPELKKNLKVAIFHPTRRSLLPWRHDWTDNILIFFEWFAKFRV